MLAPLRTALTITALHRATQRFVSGGGKSMIALVRGKISPPDKSSSVWFPPMAYSFADRVSPKVQMIGRALRFYAGATARVPPHMLRVQPGQRPRPCLRSGECRQSDS